MKSLTAVSLLLPTTLSLVLVGCGAAGSGGSPAAAGGGSSGAQGSPYSMVVASDDQLPTCSSSNDKQLIYVKSTSVFKSCDAGQWAVIEIKGKDGMTVTSNQLLNSYSANLCTRYSQIENCVFNGGQIVKYSDGSVLLTGGYSYNMFVSGSDVGDIDRMTSSITMLVPPDAQYFWQRLDWDVARGLDDGKSLFMVYDRANDKIILIYDTDDNGRPDPTDEILHTVLRTAT